MKNKGMWIGISALATALLFVGGTIVSSAISKGVIAREAVNHSVPHQSGMGESGKRNMKDEVGAPLSEVTAGSTSEETVRLLSYLVEEEKLAHDVYSVLGDKWGTRVFSNISRSEDRHQSIVAELLAAYGITDPRTSQVGEFTNPELQQLYDDLIAQGSISQASAIEVGILIEKTDISDLERAMKSIDVTQIDAVLSALLNASYNHLNAFSRQS